GPRGGPALQPGAEVRAGCWRCLRHAVDDLSRRRRLVVPDRRRLATHARPQTRSAHRDAPGLRARVVTRDRRLAAPTPTPGGPRSVRAQGDHARRPPVAEAGDRAFDEEPVRAKHETTLRAPAH